jgi:hypothetical protein
MSHKIEKQRLPVVEQTCFEVSEKFDCNCQKKSCKQWIPYEKGNNCILVTTRKGPLTLREIGDIYGLTRMRICQIEKKIYKKIKEHIIMM